MILLDTHAALWAVLDDKLLGRHSRDLVLQAFHQDELAISAISLWEIALLAERERIGLSVGPRDVLERLRDARFQEIPLSSEIAILSTELGLHGDPADRFIAATAVYRGAILVTADKRLLKWRHSLKRQDARR